jgi:hypothetical protein
MIEKPFGVKGADDAGDSSLGKRKQSGDEDRPLPAKPAPAKKARPLDSFVVRIKRNTVSTCCM